MAAACLRSRTRRARNGGGCASARRRRHRRIQLPHIRRNLVARRVTARRLLERRCAARTRRARATKNRCATRYRVAPSARRAGRTIFACVRVRPEVVRVARVGVDDRARRTRGGAASARREHHARARSLFLAAFSSAVRRITRALLPDRDRCCAPPRATIRKCRSDLGGRSRPGDRLGTRPANALCPRPVRAVRDVLARRIPGRANTTRHRLGGRRRDCAAGL